MQRRNVLTGVFAFGLLWLTRSRAHAAPDVFPVRRTEAEWRRRLSPTQYAILRGQGTERPGSSPLDHETQAGRYDCVGCDRALFASTAKFDSHTGWPSFWQPLPGGVATGADRSLGIQRTEVQCANCGGHLGHVFDDGPKPTGLRYCMNGAVLSFHPGAA